MNRRNRLAQFAGRASTSLHCYLVFKEKGETQTEEAVVTDIHLNELEIIVPRYGFDGTIPHLTEEEGAVSTIINGETVALYDRIQVEFTVALEKFMKTINFKFIRKL